MPNQRNLPEVWRERSGWMEPFRGLSRLQRDIDSLFGDFFTSFPSMRMPGEGMLGFSPPCDVQESETNYAVSFDLPGVPKSDLKIELRDHQLLVSGERKAETKKEEGRVLSAERYYGAFQRVFTLPANVDASRIQANYQDGVLQILIPKAEAAKATMIKIGEGKIEKKAA